MLNKSVTVVDVRSSDMTAVVAERGVNKTFVIKSKFSCGYDGFAEGQLIDARSFASAFRSVVKSTSEACGGRIGTLYVSVPGEFTDVCVTDNTISFESSKRVGRGDVKALEESSRPAKKSGWRHIGSGCLYYVLSDMRRVVDPVGLPSDSLRGRLCHYLCAASFCEACRSALSGTGLVSDIRYIPSAGAEAMYLLSPEKRDEYAVLFDFGFISSTFSVACGNGVVFSESFSLGAGHIALYLTETLGVSFEAAEQLLGKVNLNSVESRNGTIEVVSEGRTCSFLTYEVKDRIREALDGICEAIEECAASFTERNLDYKALNITGESAMCVRGAVDYMCSRLSRKVEVAAPGIPFYNKPCFGPLFSLIDAAVEEREDSSVLSIISKIFR